MLYLDPVVVGPDTARHWPRLMSALGRSQPDLIVVSRKTYKAVAPSAPVFPWIRQRYVPANTGDLGQPTYLLFVRRGSPLEARLRGPAATRP